MFVKTKKEYLYRLQGRIKNVFLHRAIRFPRKVCCVFFLCSNDLSCRFGHEPIPTCTVSGLFILVLWSLSSCQYSTVLASQEALEPRRLTLSSFLFRTLLGFCSSWASLLHHMSFRLFMSSLQKIRPPF